MTKTFFSVAATAVFLSLCPAFDAMAQSADPGGLWLTEAGDARVRVSKCGNGYCGSVAALTTPIDPKTGKLQVDDHNPNPRLANRPIVGIRLFGDMQPAGPNKWAGHIYNADDGKTYESSLSMAGPDTLRVEGCVIGICGGENWRRVGR